MKLLSSLVGLSLARLVCVRMLHEAKKQQKKVG